MDSLQTQRVGNSSPTIPLTSSIVSSSSGLQEALPSTLPRAYLVHHMQTRSLNNTSRPKVTTNGTIPYPPRALLFAIDAASQKPTRFRSASKDPIWHQAMHEEFNALLRK
jgi:hypothetical protein